MSRPAPSGLLRRLGHAVLPALLLLLAGCGGGSSSSGGTGPLPEPTIDVSGAAVDGPIANATVRIYRLDPSAPGLAGALLDEGATDAQAQFTGLDVDSSERGPFLIVVSADADTVDLNTGNPPIISEVRTVVGSDALDAPVYATPLTTMAVDLTVAKADDDGSVTLEEFESGLEDAAAEVVSALGFGMDDGIDIFTVPPLVTDATDSEEEMAQVAQYRTAISGAAAIVFQIEQNSASGASAGDVLASLADDLSDGSIDGMNSEMDVIDDYQGDDAAVIVATDPDNLTVPGTELTVEETELLLSEETEQTGTTTDPSVLADGTVSSDAQPAEADVDKDGDGVLNTDDAFPNDPSESQDNDGDGVGNNADPDDDNDGVNDAQDDFPLLAEESVDSDGDGIGDNADMDDDGDGVEDAQDDFPLDPNASAAADVDGDGWPAGQDTDDNDATTPGTEFVDTDGDGIGNVTDPDDDNDGVPDEADDLPVDASESSDTDGDGAGDLRDDDIDGDGVPNHTGGDPSAETSAAVSPTANCPDEENPACLNPKHC